jgi:hypothetical protein
VNCPVCAETRVVEFRWTYTCRACGFAWADLPVHLDKAEVLVDEEDCVRALQPLRMRNFSLIVDLLKRTKPAPARLLDIGSSHGWFLGVADSAGYLVEGVEPSDVALEIPAPHIRVRRGFFPEVLSRDERFDIITFHDVFEHLPNVIEQREHLVSHLSDAGLVVVNLPVSDGLFYKVANMLAHLGWDGPFKRLWQVGLWTPHLSYFSHKSLTRFFEQRGFVERGRIDLKTMELAGSWKRARLGGRALPMALLTYGGAIALMIISRLFPSDAHCRAYERPPSNHTL